MRSSVPAVLAMAAAVVAAQPAPADVAVIVDTDSPVEDPGGADRLRDATLTGDVDPSTRFFQITARGIAALPDASAEAVRALSFGGPPPVYSGISLTVNEASEILRRNEPVLAEVVRRSCAPEPRGDCGRAVHAAAARLIEDSNAATAVKIGALLHTLRSVPAKTIVLITAGWPYQEAPRVMDDVVRELGRHAVALVVCRMPSSVAYRGRVRDAVETIASRARATVVTIEDEPGAERVRLAYLHRRAAPTEPVSPVAAPEPAAAAVAPPAPREETNEAGAGFTANADATLRRAADYVARFEKTFAAVTWRERYQQEDRTQRRFNASGGRFTTLDGKRVLDSELLLVWLPADASWIAVRDVIAVDGVPRAAADRRVQRALSGPPVSVDQLRQLASENGRYNIGRIVRTFNEPTLALLLLDVNHRHRFEFRRGRRQTLGGRPAVAYEFDERARPTLIRNRDRDVPARGVLWISESTGQVIETVLELNDKTASLQGRMTVRYDTHAQFDVLVPVEMRETYTAPSGEEVATVATYSDFRRFETTGRIIIPQP